MNITRLTAGFMIMAMFLTTATGIAEAEGGIPVPPELEKLALPGETIVDYRLVDVNQNGLNDFIIYSTIEKKGQLLSEHALSVLLKQADGGTYSRNTLLSESVIQCSDFAFVPGPKSLSAVISVWTPGSSSGHEPCMFFVLGDRFVKYTGFAQIGTAEYSIKRENGQAFLVSDTPIAYHKCGVPFSPASTWFGFKGTLFLKVKIQTNQPASAAEMINLAAYYLLNDEYSKAAGIYRKVHDTIMASSGVSDETIDLVTESLFYLAKSQEAGGRKKEAVVTFNQLIDLYPEHWMAQAAKGEVEFLEE